MKLSQGASVARQAHNLPVTGSTPVPATNIGPGSKVKFIAHGETGLPHTVVTRDGDDCCLCDPRGRMLPNVPFELLVLVPGPPPNPAFRAVDELTGAPIKAERIET